MAGEVETVLPAGYDALLAEPTASGAQARWRAQRAVNTELVSLHWWIGQPILDRNCDQPWGAEVTDRLATGMSAAFQGMQRLIPAASFSCL